MKLKLILALLAATFVMNCGEDTENPVVDKEPETEEVITTEVVEKDTIEIDPVTGDTTIVTVKDTVESVVTVPVEEATPDDTTTTPDDTTKPDDTVDDSGITLESSLPYEISDEDEAEAADLAKLARVRSMVLIPSKNRVFRMGSDVYYNEELVSEFSQPFAKEEEELSMPAHLVKFSYNFYMMKTEVAASEYVEIMNEATSYFHDSTKTIGSSVWSALNNSAGGYERLYADANGTNSGVDYNQAKGELEVLTGASKFVAHSISWYGAAFFCNALSRKHGLEEVYDRYTWDADFSKNGFRLPTEAEWEYACRAGSDTPFYWGDIDKAYESDDYVVDEIGFVAQKEANEFGLYDMIGNVREWTQNDFYTYENKGQIDEGLFSNVYENDATLRGGVFNEGIQRLSTLRYSGSKNSANSVNGFRYVLPIK